ncbi:MAG: hypothetical protein JSV19_11265 [Phycisphaerales bacterium]|nr:MAG: hypothetical protein JSV19_11265 [Phycisphaerales bacterium]
MRSPIWASVSPLLILTAFGLVRAANVTLSDAAILLLDYDMHDQFQPNLTATIVDTRDIPGPGVEFDIQFFGLDYEDTQFWHLSSEYGGSGALVGLDLSPYGNFQLRFTLVAVDGDSSPGSGGDLAVGAVVGDHDSLSFHPEGLSLGGSYGTTAVSSISTSYGGPPVSHIGFIAYYRPGVGWVGWSPDGNLVTLRVEPVDWAVAILAEPGDFDADGDLDLSDYAMLAFCIAGPDYAFPGGHLCRIFDFDGDSDVDLADFAEFQAAFTG